MRAFRCPLTPYLALDTLARLAKRWAGMSPHDWMRNLIIEVLSAHQRVAIRKLGQSGEDTLMFRTLKVEKHYGLYL
jgi:hypothetical protein